jgi:AcrR family transcriptional regulator
MSRATYHHGDLRAVILAEAARLVAEGGAERLSLRELARAAGVSHAAPAHHFTDRRGLFTALAAEGFTKLAAALEAARPQFLAAALAYVDFALRNPGHFAVMFDTSLLDTADAELIAAQTAAGAELSRGVSTLTGAKARENPADAELAAWSMVHGFSMLWLNNAFTPDIAAADPMELAERMGRMLFDG